MSKRAIFGMFFGMVLMTPLIYVKSCGDWSRVAMSWGAVVFIFAVMGFIIWLDLKRRF